MFNRTRNESTQEYASKLDKAERQIREFSEANEILAARNAWLERRVADLGWLESKEAQSLQLNRTLATISKETHTPECARERAAMLEATDPDSPMAKAFRVAATITEGRYSRDDCL